MLSSTKRIFQRTAVNIRSKRAWQAANSANMGVKIGLADSNNRIPIFKSEQTGWLHYNNQPVCSFAYFF